MKVNLDVIKRGLDTVADYAKTGCAIVFPVVIMAVAEKGAKRIANKIYYGGKVKYDDAIRAILDSDMYSSAKKEAVSLVKTDGDFDYYRSVIYVVESSMYSSAKVETIKELSKVKQIEEDAQA